MTDLETIQKIIKDNGIRNNTLHCHSPKERPSRMVENMVCGVDPANESDYSSFAWICMKCGTVNSDAICSRCGNR